MQVFPLEGALAPFLSIGSKPTSRHRTIPRLASSVLARLNITMRRGFEPDRDYQPLLFSLSPPKVISLLKGAHRTTMLPQGLECEAGFYPAIQGFAVLRL